MREPEQDKLLIHALWLLSLLYVHCEVVRQDAWDSSRSGTNFSFVQELTEGASSTIVVPGNHSVAGEFADLQTPIQLTRWGIEVPVHMRPGSKGTVQQQQQQQQQQQHC
jgi:hypothetical protein